MNCGNKKAVQVFVLLSLCILWAACGQGPVKSPRKVFRMNFSSGSLEAIDPAFAKDLYQIWVNHMVYNTLVETDEQLHVIPSLAKNWEIGDSGRLLTFHLRSDVYFQDNPAFADGKGRLCIAADIVYSFSRLLNPATASTGAWIFNGHISQNEPFKALDDTTFQLKLMAPFRPMIGSLSMAYCNIVPHEVVEKWGRDYRSHPCGTGPYMLNYWDEGNMLCLIKNQHYWQIDENGVHLPYTDAIKISFVDSKATEFLLFMQHKLDFVNGIDGSFKDLILSKNGAVKREFEKKFTLRKGTYLNTEYLGFLTDTQDAVMNNEPTRNVLVRRAINYAIDRRKIVAYYKNGMGIPATKGFIPSGIPGFDSAAHYGYDYNPAMAQMLLAQAGYPGGNGLKPIKLLVPDNLVDIMNFIAGELQEVGIKAKIETIQPNILKQQMSSSKAVVFRANWLADYPDAETFLVVFNSSQPAPPNYTRFRNDTFDRWYNKSLSLPDTARWAIYGRMDSLVSSFAPVLPLYYDIRMHFLQNNVSGFHSNAMNLIDLNRVKLQ